MLCRLLLQCGKLFFEFFLLPLVLRHEVVYACPRNPAAVPNIFLPTPSPLFLMLIVYKVMLPLWEHYLKKFQSFFYWLERWKPFLTRIVIMTFLLSRSLMTKLINSKDFFKKVGIIFFNSHKLWFFESDNISSKVGITFFNDYIKNAILLENGFFPFTSLNKSSILSDL